MAKRKRKRGTAKVSTAASNDVQFESKLRTLLGEPDVSRNEDLDEVWKWKENNVELAVTFTGKGAYYDLCDYDMGMMEGGDMTEQCIDDIASFYLSLTLEV